MIEDAGQRHWACPLTGGLADPSCSRVSSGQRNPESSAAAPLPPFNLRHTHQLLHRRNTPGRARLGCSRSSLVPHGPIRESIQTVEQARVAVPAAGQPRGRGAGRKSRLGWGGSPGPGAPSRGCRAPGRRLPATEGLRRSPDSEVPARTGSEVPAAGSPERGLSGCTLHWATPAPSLQHFGVTGMDQALNNQSAAALKPEP